MEPSSKQTPPQNIVWLVWLFQLVTQIHSVKKCSLEHTWNFMERDFRTGIFLWIFWNFWKLLFWRTSENGSMLFQLRDILDKKIIILWKNNFRFRNTRKLGKTRTFEQNITILLRIKLTFLIKFSIMNLSRLVYILVS